MSTRFRIPCPGTLVLAAAAVVVTAVALHGGSPGEHLVGWLVADRTRVLHGELWRLWTGPFVHSSWSMLARDAGMLVVLGALYERVFPRRTVAWIVLAGLAVPTLAVLVFNPGFDAYFGLSGTANAMFLAAFVHELRWRAGGARAWWLIFVFSLYAIKLVYEAATGQLLLPIDLGAVQPAPVSHVAGAAVGVLVPLWRPRGGDGRGSTDQAPSRSNRANAVRLRA